MSERQDVVVVGGGLAGLSCARALRAAGAAVVVLEARDRVGGRTLSQQVGKGVFDLGGQWVGPRQHRLLALARELGVETFATYSTGKKVLALDGNISSYDGTIPSLAPWKLLELHTIIGKIDRMTARVSLERPMETPGARLLDTRTLEDWKVRKVWSKHVRDVFDAAVRVVFGAEACEVSLLHFLFYLRSGGGLMHLCSIEGGAQETRFKRGAQAISLELAKGLDVRLSAPVRALVQDDDGVTVRSDVGELRARYAVVAIPPALAGRIDYRPTLPVQRDQLTQRYPMGATVKCLALYERAFWRERGFSGEAVCNPGPVCVVFDNTSHDGAQPALLAFVVGQEARTWSARPERERRDAVLGTFARLFGAEAGQPLEYQEHDWSAEEWTRGCPVGVPTPGVLTQASASLRAPVGRLHFAGTETAIEWNGYMDGALESGARAAKEIVARL